MVGFCHWHIPTFIITDISPPWWDFVMVGMCWVTMINPQILLPSAIFVDNIVMAMIKPSNIVAICYICWRRQASELQKEQPIQALRSAWRLFKKMLPKKHPILKKCYLIWLRQTDFDVNHPVKGFQTTSQQERQKKFHTLQLSWMLPARRLISGVTWQLSALCTCATNVCCKFQSS